MLYSSVSGSMVPCPGKKLVQYMVVLAGPVSQYG